MPLASSGKETALSTIQTGSAHWWLNEEALAYTFFLSLSEEIKKRLATVNFPSSFEALVKLVVDVDNLLQEQLCGSTEPKGCQHWRQPHSTTTTTTHSALQT